MVGVMAKVISTTCSVHLQKAYEFTVVPDGYGLSYAIGPEYVRWGITCSKTHPEGKNRHGQPWKNAQELKEALEEAADETSAMLEAGNPEKIPMKRS